MDPFKNVNNKVTRQLTGTRTGTRLNGRVEGNYNSSAIENMSAVEEATTWRKNLDKKIHLNAVKENMSNATNFGLEKQRIRGRSEKTLIEAREAAFTDILYSLYEGSLYLDDSFVTERRPQLENYVAEYVKENGGFAFLEKAVKANPNNHVLRIIAEGCKKVAADYVSNFYVMMEAADSDIKSDKIKFVKTGEIKDELDKIKKDVSIDELTDAVKTKVLTVIKDEKERQAKEKELSDQINQLSEEEQKQLESFSVLITKKPVEETSLFVAIMRNSYKTLLTESAQEALTILRTDSDKPDGGESIDGYDTAQTIDEFNDEHKEDVDAVVNMDLVLAESIARYTLMELTNTIQLENYGYARCKSIVNDLLYK